MDGLEVECEVMYERELQIYGLLQEADEFAFVPPDKSDLYALAPDNMQPGLIRIPGEYTNKSEDQINKHIADAMEDGNWRFIPLSSYVRDIS